MTLTSNMAGLWWVVVPSTLAGVVAFAGAFAGVSHHRIMPRMMTAAGLIAMGLSYWFELLDVAVWTAHDLRRGAAIVLWPALLWTAVSEIRYTRERKELVEHVLGEVLGDE